MSNIIVSHVIQDGKAFPEISRINGRITTQTVKIFLFENNLIDGCQFMDKKLDYSVIVPALYKAFESGLLSLNATKQKGVKNLTPVRLSTGLAGKMKDVWAISTISLCNAFCLARMKNPELVCYHCYVKKSLRIDGILQYTQNMFVLSQDIPDEWIPVLDEKQAVNHPIIRLESMGDLMTVQQAKNYLRIAQKNQAFRFGIWTKNPAVFGKAVDGIGMPDNLSSVLSMSRVNKMDVSEKYNRYFNHRFIVVNDDNIRDNYLSNPDFYPCKCGKRSCITCQKCYTKDSTMTTAVERLRK